MPAASKLGLALACSGCLHFEQFTRTNRWAKTPITLLATR